MAHRFGVVSWKSGEKCVEIGGFLARVYEGVRGWCKFVTFRVRFEKKHLKLYFIEVCFWHFFLRRYRDVFDAADTTTFAGSYAFNWGGKEYYSIRYRTTKSVWCRDVEIAEVSKLVVFIESSLCFFLLSSVPTRQHSLHSLLFDPKAVRHVIFRLWKPLFVCEFVWV